MSIEELDKIIDEILSNAEEEKKRIIEHAKTRAIEIQKRPIPIEEFRREAEEMIKNAKIEAERIIKEAEKKALDIRNIKKEKIEEAVSYLLKHILGLEAT